MSFPKRIIVLTASPDAMQPVIEALSQQGADVKCVSEIYHFVATFAARPPEAAIIDADGFSNRDLEMLRALREVRPASALIVMVRPDQHEIASGAFCSGADFYLLKPAGKAELLEAVKRATSGDVVAGADARAEVISRFAVGVAERINTPLAVISGWLQLLNHDYANDNALADKLSLMKEEIDHIAEITSRLLSFASQGAPRNDRVDIPQLLTELGRLHSANFLDKGILVKLDVDRNTLPVLGDQAQLRLALESLLEYSLSALNGDGMLEITSRPRDGGVEIVFQDNGPPIPPERIKDFFEPFAPARVNGNSGLDLAIARGTILSHGGKIEARSDASPMTQIIVWLSCLQGGPEKR